MSNGTETDWQSNSLPEWYNKYMLGHDSMKQYASLFKFNNEDKVLDLGCGDGTLLKIASPVIKSGIGVDLSDIQLDIANKNLKNLRNITLWKNTLQEIALTSNSFTKVSIRKAIHHLNNDEKGILIDKVYKCLNENGIFIIEDLITMFALHRKDERLTLIENSAAKYYGNQWPKVRDAFFTTLNIEQPADIAQITYHLLFTGFHILKIINHTPFMTTIIAQK
jgi:cyclopropane fatty-acyl-phospholipid synthase-like methyltransferase